MRTTARIRKKFYAYVTHVNVNVLRLCTNVRICNTWES